jgi:multicomponent Na+:H+ antiporter subunit E
MVPVVLKRFALLLGVWVVLTLNAPSAYPVGVLAAAVATAISLRLLPPAGRQVRLGAVLRLAPGFVWRSLLGGLDVAWRAFHPRLPLNPRWIAYPTRLPPGAARVSLGNELSLMPGTLAAGGRDDALLIHCLDGAQPVERSIAEEEARVAEAVGAMLERVDG